VPDEGNNTFTLANNSKSTDFSRSVTVIGDRNSVQSVNILKSAMPDYGFSFCDISDKGYQGLCNAINAVKPHSKVIIQLLKQDVWYYNKKSEEWTKSWLPLVEKLNAKNVCIIFSGLLPRRNVPNVWYESASRMNKSIRDMCNLKKLTFLHAWPKFWRQDDPY
jgi:hypothetical protein